MHRGISDRLALAASTVVGAALIAACGSTGDGSAAATATRDTASVAADSRSASAAPTTSTVAPSTSAGPLAGSYKAVKRAGAPTKRVSAGNGTFKTPVRYTDGLAVSIDKVGAVKVSGEGPGNLATQQAVRLTITVDNKSKKTVDLRRVVLQLTYGSPARIAAPVYDSATQDFGTELRPGKSASAVYSFAVPTSGRGTLTLHLDLDGTHAVGVFHGSVR